MGVLATKGKPGQGSTKVENGALTARYRDPNPNAII